MLQSKNNNCPVDWVCHFYRLGLVLVNVQLLAGFDPKDHQGRQQLTVSNDFQIKIINISDFQVN